MIKKLSWFLFVSLSTASGELAEPTTIGVRSLRRHQRSKVQGRQQILTHSDDGGSKILTAFFLDIFETQGDIAEQSFPVLRLAMNNFLMDEMNAIYAPQNNELELVSSSLIGFPTVIEPTGNRRLQSNKMGTEFLMEVKLTFDNEPSPDTSELEVVIREVMSDLSRFVTNLTRFGTPDFQSVTEAYRREIPTAAPTGSTAPSTSPLPQTTISDIKVSDGQGPNNEALTPEQIAVPAILIGATFLAVLIFFAVRRRRRTNADLSKSSDPVLTDIEGGGYSFDKSLDSSRPPSPEFPSSSVSELGSQDSVFSENIADASKRLRPTKGVQGGASQKTAPTSNRMYNLLNFVNENEDLYREENKASGGRPRPTAAAFDGDGSSSEMSYVETGEPDNRIPQRQTSARNTFADIASYAACTSTSNGKGRDPTPRNASLEQKKPESKPSGGLMSMFHCAPTSGTQGETQDRERTTGNERQDIFRSRSRSPGTPTQRRPGTPNRSRNSTPNRSRPSTPTTSRPSTPSASRPSTPNRSRPSTPTSVQFTPNRIKQSVDSPSTHSQQRASTPNRSREATPERPNGKNRPTVQQNREGSGIETRPYPVHGKANDETQDQVFQRSFQVGRRKPNTNADEPNFEDTTNGDRRRPVFIEGMTHEIFYPTGGRRHAGNNGADGSAMYQANAMDPSEWSYKSYDNNSVGNSTVSDGYGALPKEIFRQRGESLPTKIKESKSEDAFQAKNSMEEDTRWIEKRIAANKQNPVTDKPSVPIKPQHSSDSLSYASNDNDMYQLNSPSDVYSSKDESVMSSIVCRDCYAPPGKLNIIIHSTKDGPAVHTVKPGSSLEGHLFPGDLIISVDNVDTRSFTAEHVMKMMAAKSTQERKITVLHFEEESQI